VLPQLVYVKVLLVAHQPTLLWAVQLSACEAPMPMVCSSYPCVILYCCTIGPMYMGPVILGQLTVCRQCAGRALTSRWIPVWPWGLARLPTIL